LHGGSRKKGGGGRTNKKKTTKLEKHKKHSVKRHSFWGGKSKGKGKYCKSTSQKKRHMGGGNEKKTPLQAGGEHQKGSHVKKVCLERRVYGAFSPGASSIGQSLGAWGEELAGGKRPTLARCNVRTGKATRERGIP